MEQWVSLTEEEEVRSGQTLEDWVTHHVQLWQDYYSANYREKHDEYYRLWRGVWAAEDKTRDSERSRLIAPALQQAVESNVADLEEATFGGGTWFKMSDDVRDEDNKDIVMLRKLLQQDLRRANVEVDIMEAGVIGAVYGTGIIEIDIDQIESKKVATRPAMNGQLQQFGVESSDMNVVRGIPTQPRNFFIDPDATCIDDALGCGTDRFVARHKIVELQEKGVYRNVDIGSAASDADLEVDTTIDSTVQHDERIRLTKYYGLVPRALLKEATDVETNEDETVVELVPTDKEDDSHYVEAIVVLGNGHLLKAEENPFMMRDRNIVAFQWDVVPGSFWGRGVCEKGYNSQKALDTEMRARADALALTTHPMMGVDGSRMPRGAKPQVRPGKNVITNGNPAEILLPFKFGAVDQITFAQSEALQRMVMQATGASDATSLPGQAASGEATLGGMSMALSAVVKRHRRTLANFQKNLVEKFVEKAAWRYMQYDPERYPPKDYTFTVTGSMGMAAREYEVQQLVQMLQVVPEGPAKDTLIDAVIETMGLSKSEQILEILKKSREPNPETTQMQQRDVEAEISIKEAQAAALQGQAKESTARAVKYMGEAKAIPRELAIEEMKAITYNMRDNVNDENDEQEFQRRLKIGELFIKDREARTKEKAVELQARGIKGAPNDNSKAQPQDLGTAGRTGPQPPGV